MSRSLPYVDPLDALWLDCAKKLGLRIERSGETYASTSGRGELRLGSGESLDRDDCLAQMILHELCHSLVSGRESFDWIDWGLDNETDRDVVLEHATLRLQAALLEPLGLRRVLAPTTEFRAFYDALPADPFLEIQQSERPSIVRARAGYARRVERPWAPHLTEALRGTAHILSQVASYRGGGEARDLLGQIDPPARIHRSGLPAHPTEARGDQKPYALCGDCGWFIHRPSGRHGCRQTKSPRIDATESACAHFEPTLDCQSCGACCREAYDAVEVSAREPMRLFAPSLLVRRGPRYEIPRPERRCGALTGGAELAIHRPAIPSAAPETEQTSPPFYMPSDEPFSCSIYDIRPKTCRDFTRGGAHCLTARRRVGLSL